jgi:hypothetical protein
MVQEDFDTDRIVPKGHDQWYTGTGEQVFGLEKMRGE